MVSHRENLAAVPAVVRMLSSTDVVLQRALQRAGLIQIFFKNLGTDFNSGFHFMNGFKTAELFEAFGMHFGVNLHQTFRTDRAAGLRVKRGFSRNNCQNQQRINIVIFARNKCLFNNFRSIFAVNAVMLGNKTSGIGFHSINDLLLGFKRLGQILAFEIGVAQRFNLQRRLGLRTFRISGYLRRGNC